MSLQYLPPDVSHFAFNAIEQTVNHKLVISIIPIFMIDLNRKLTIKKIELIEKSEKKDRFTYWLMIDLLFTIDHQFFIKLQSLLIDRIYILTMKTLIIGTWKGRSYMIKNLWLDRKIGKKRSTYSLIDDRSFIYDWSSIFY